MRTSSSVAIRKHETGLLPLVPRCTRASSLMNSLTATSNTPPPLLTIAYFLRFHTHTSFKLQGLCHAVAERRRRAKDPEPLGPLIIESAGDVIARGSISGVSTTSFALRYLILPASRSRAQKSLLFPARQNRSLGIPRIPRCRTRLIVPQRISALIKLQSFGGRHCLRTTR